ncbi:hypothetical protein LCGC14_3075900, partial [marine sediment metagenome]
MDEIGVTYEKYHYNILIIGDELLAASKKRMRAFCEGVQEGRAKYAWDFDWMFQTHANAKLDKETLELAKNAGCYFFSYGIESGSQKVLKSMNKKIKLSQVIEAMELAKQAKLGFGANLIFGDPAETQETWAETLAFWLKHCQDNFVFLSQLMPYPGSAVFDGRFPSKKDYYEHIDEHATNLTQIPQEKFGELLGLTGHLEEKWMFIKQATGVETQLDGDGYHTIKATCPHCGEESVYRNTIPGTPFFLGLGCVHCNQ